MVNEFKERSKTDLILRGLARKSDEGLHSERVRDNNPEIVMEPLDQSGNTQENYQDKNQEVVDLDNSKASPSKVKVAQARRREKKKQKSG